MIGVVQARWLTLGAAAVAMCAAVPAPAQRAARPAAETLVVLPDLNGTGVKRTKTVFGYQQRFRVVVSGTVEARVADESQNVSYDPFFCFKGWCAVQSKKLRVAAFAGLSAT